MKHLLPALGLASFVLVVRPVWAGESCPGNQIVVSRTDVGFASTAPTGSIVWTQAGDQIVPWDAAQVCPEGCYDLPKATLVARGFNSLYGPAGTLVGVADDYVVLGPAGPAFSFEVVLQLNATIDVEGTVQAGLGVTGSASQSIVRTATGRSEPVLPVVVAPGAPIEISAFAYGVGGHLDGSGLAEGVIRFRGLPAGYTVSSCQGYDQSTPANPQTWGAVKAHYR